MLFTFSRLQLGESTRPGQQSLGEEAFTVREDTTDIWAADTLIIFLCVYLVVRCSLRSGVTIFVFSISILVVFFYFEPVFQFEFKTHLQDMLCF